MDRERRDLSRRDFIKQGTAAGAGVTALTVVASSRTSTASAAQADWQHSADVVVVDAGASGLPAAIMARDQGASVVVIEENYSIGGHDMVSGGNLGLGGGTSLQKKYGIEDFADQLYLDHTDHTNDYGRYADRELIRAWSEENAPTFEFLIENGVRFYDEEPQPSGRMSTPRSAKTRPFSNDLNETINGRPGSGLVRHLEASARRKGVRFLLLHKAIRLLRQGGSRGRVTGVSARFEDTEVNIQVRRGVILATGGHTSNVDLRRMFDPRLTEEYQVPGEPWTKQTGDGEIMAMEIGAALWATANQTASSRPVHKPEHIGCRYGYGTLKWNPKSPMFQQAGASGLSVRDYQDVVFINQVGLRFWDELDGSRAFVDACLGTNGSLGRSGQKANGGGPIWAIFDSEAVKRERWNPRPPHVDPNGFFFRADTIEELAQRISNPYQLQPVPPAVLDETIRKYNSYVDLGRDPDFGRSVLLHKIQTPPFYAAWATPILHDSCTGLRIDPRCRVVDIHSEGIPGLYCAGESAGGFALHGLPRVVVFGRIADREAALDQAS